MGKIKSKLIRRTATGLIDKGIEFKEDFKINKKILGREMPSKRLRNQLAGFLSRLKRQEKENQLKVK